MTPAKGEREPWSDSFWVSGESEIMHPMSGLLWCHQWASGCPKTNRITQFAIITYVYRKNYDCDPHDSNLFSEPLALTNRSGHLSAMASKNMKRGLLIISDFVEHEMQQPSPSDHSSSHQSLPYVPAKPSRSHLWLPPHA